jgi:Kef-type K+ transport system membrane component KefB
MNYFFEHLQTAFHLPLQNPVLIFSLMLFIILLSPIILRKVKIPAIIGLIISGVIIGFLSRVEKAYPENDTVIIYPGQEKENLFSTYEDVSGNAIGLGVETIQKIGKEVGSIFKKNKETDSE